MKNLIESISQVTPAFLTELLHQRGVIRSGRIRRLTIVRRKRLIVSVVARIAIEWSTDAPPGAPDAIFLKLSAPDRSPRARQDHSDQEVVFYRDLASQYPAGPFIRCFDAEYSQDTKQYHLVLEDLTPTHEQPPDPEPPSAEHSIAAIGALAQVHAYWWQHPRLGRGIGDVFNTGSLESFTNEVKENVSRFTRHLGSQMDRKAQDAYRLLIERRHVIWGRLMSTNGMTVTHGDAHWWNFLYPRSGSNDKTRLFDWQLWHVDLGARDLAFLVSLGGFAMPRPELESIFLQTYHSALISGGVKDYSYDDLLTDYRWSAVRNLNIPVIHWSQGRTEHTWRRELDIALRAFRSLECMELLI